MGRGGGGGGRRAFYRYILSYCWESSGRRKGGILRNFSALKCSRSSRRKAKVLQQQLDRVEEEEGRRRRSGGVGVGVGVRLEGWKGKGKGP